MEGDELSIVEPEEEEEEEPRYYIDVDWYDQSHLSFLDMAADRMCADCQRRLDEEVEERVPTIDPTTRRPTYELRRYKRRDRPIPRIRDCCSRRSGYITPELPTLEAVFRILLANGNQPMPLEHVRDQLREWCATGRCQWLLIPPESLRRVVDADRFYGLRRHQLPDAA